jgi:hypothetical protein
MTTEYRVIGFGKLSNVAGFLAGPFALKDTASAVLVAAVKAHPELTTWRVVEDEVEDNGGSEFGSDAGHG